MDLALERLSNLADILDVLIAFDEHFPRSISSRVDALETHARKLTENAIVYRATATGLTAGFIAFYANSRIEATAFLTHLAVAPQFRGAGVGRALINRCIDDSKAAAMKQIKLEVDGVNESAIGFYRSLGFVEAGPASAASIFMLRSNL